LQIQVNTDDNIEGRDELTQKVQAEIATTLGRFADRITRVEVHLSDENAGKSGTNDKRCLMEVRPTGRQPVAVTHQAGSLAEAWNGASKKMRTVLDTTFGRLDDTKGGASIRPT
jgi:hypothetical protein